MDLNKIFIDELGNMLHAEKQILSALPKMAQATNSNALRRALDEELQETKAQATRIEEVFRVVSKPARPNACPGMQGILAEGLELVREHAKNGPGAQTKGAKGAGKKRTAHNGKSQSASEAQDRQSADAQTSAMEAGLIACMQKAIHYRVAAHGTLAAWAGALDQPAAQRLLRENLMADEDSDRELSDVAERLINPRAAGDQHPRRGAAAERLRERGTQEREPRGVASYSQRDAGEGSGGRWRDDDLDRDRYGRFATEGRGQDQGRGRRDNPERDDAGRFGREGNRSERYEDERRWASASRHGDDEADSRELQSGRAYEREERGRGSLGGERARLGAPVDEGRGRSFGSRGSRYEDQDDRDRRFGTEESRRGFEQDRSVASDRFAWDDRELRTGRSERRERR